MPSHRGLLHKEKGYVAVGIPHSQGVSEEKACVTKSGTPGLEVVGSGVVSLTFLRLYVKGLMFCGAGATGAPPHKAWSGKMLALGSLACDGLGLLDSRGIIVLHC